MNSIKALSVFSISTLLLCQVAFSASGMGKEQLGKIANDNNTKALKKAKQTKEKVQKPSSVSAPASPSTTQAPVPVATSAVVSVAAAEEGSSGGTKKYILDHLRVTYFGILYGPAIGKWDTNVPDQMGVTSDKVYLFNNIGVGWRFNSKVSVAAATRFNFLPFGTPASGNFSGQWLDPRISASHNSVIKTPYFSLWSGINADLPLSENSQRRQLIIAPATLQILTLQVPRTDLTLGSYFSIRTFFFNTDYSTGGNSWASYAAPFAQYQVAKNLSLNLLYEFNWNLPRSASGSTVSWVKQPTDLQPGVNWTIFPNFTVTPFVNFFTDQAITLNNTYFGMWISATLI